MTPFWMPVYQMLPCASSASPCGWLLAGRSNSRIWPVRGSRRPSLSANWPVHQIDPSAAACESCGRDPSVGAIHSLMSTVAGPESSTAPGSVLDRVVRGQIGRDGLELRRRQLHHGGDAVLPAVLGVAPRAGDQVETMAARAGGLHLLAAGAFRQLHRRRPALPAPGAPALPARGGLLHGGRREREAKEYRQRQAEKRSLSHTASSSSSVRVYVGYYACGARKLDLSKLGQVFPPREAGPEDDCPSEAKPR